MKFLYVGDLHQDELVPINRIDEFNETRNNKISEILKIAKQNKVNAILHGGDFFNKPKMSNEFVTHIIETWNNKLIPIDIQDLTFKFKAGTISEKEYITQLNEYKKNNIPLISIIGNHDIIGDNIESYPKTSLNVLETSGFLHIVDKEHPIIFKDNNFNVAITGCHYNRELDKNSDKEGYCVLDKVKVDGKDCTYQIHITHGMLTSISYGKKFAHTMIADIQDKTLADLTINGHDHIGFDTVYYKNKIFANPGSPFRLFADKKEINRLPKVLLISINENEITVKDIYLESAKKGDLVLSDDAKKIAKNKQSAMAKIQSMINQSSMKKGVRISDIINNIGGALNINKDILTDVQNKIIQSVNLLQPPFNPSGNYYITRLELENFLSHKNSVFDFEEGLNILSGESRSGKSAVLRALREVLTCYITQPRDAIFFGASYFSITLYTSNGYIVTRRVEKDDKKGFNGYEIYDPKTGISTKYNTKAVGMVQEILGYNKIPLTEKKSIDVNSVIQGDGWFYIGNGISAPDRARLLGVVYGTHYADAANKEISSDIKKTNTQINLIQKEKERLEVQKSEYNYLTKLGNDISDSEIILNKLEKQEIELLEIKKLTNKLETLNYEINELKKIKASLNVDLKPYLYSLKESFKMLTIAKETYKNMISIVNQGKTFRPLQKDLKYIYLLKTNLLDLKDKVMLLKEDKDRYNKFVYLQQQETNILNEKNILNKVQQELSYLSLVKPIVKELEQKEVAFTRFKENVNQVLNLKAKLDNIKMNIEKYNRISKSFNNLPSLNEIKQFYQKELDLQKMKNIFDELEIIKKEGIEQKKYLSEIKDKNFKYIEIYKQQLEEVQTCPICHSNIDANIVNHLVSSHLLKIGK